MSTIEKTTHPLIQLRVHPSQAPSYTQLVVNGFTLGEYIYGKDKPYLNPEKWARKMVKKRMVVISRNITRLEEELARWRKEKEAINIFE